MNYYVYILRCEDDSLYTGMTTDLERRFAEHCGSDGRGAKYTRSHRPVSLERAWACPDKNSALSLEYRIKRLSRAQKNALLLGRAPAGLCLDDFECVYRG